MKFLKLYLLLLLLYAASGTRAQFSSLDSMLTALEHMADDTNKVNTLNALADLLYQNSPEEAVKYGYQAKDLALKLGFYGGMAKAFTTIERASYIQGNYQAVYQVGEESLKIFEELGDDRETARILSNLGSFSYVIGNNGEAISFNRRALKISEMLEDYPQVGLLLLNIGQAYSKQRATLDSALHYYQRVIALAENREYIDLLGMGTMNLGKLYLEEGELELALYNFEKSLTILNLPVDIASSLTYIGEIYSKKGDEKQAIIYYNDALKMDKKANAPWETADILQRLASSYRNQKLFEKAISYYQQAEAIAERNGLQNELSNVYEGLAHIYADQLDFTEAFKYLLIHDSIYHAINKMESEGRSNRDLINSYQMEKKQNEIAILEQQSEIEQLSSKRQRSMLIATGAFGLFLLAMAVGFFHRMQFIRKTNQKINAQNEMITDSISYAQRIQSAVLPSQQAMNKAMPEHFVILKPKDIVSGDFYWIKEVKDHLVIVGADCTGHGVPGAFMSMLGITLLSNLVNGQSCDAPGEILEKLRVRVKEMLVQEGGTDAQKDGMDMALAIFHRNTRELHFAGANNPLYVIRHKDIPAGKDLEPYADAENGAYQLYELKGDLQPIGAHWEETRFTSRSIMLRERDTFYLFSDGYMDQFGGDHRKKFKSVNFKKLLLSMQDKPMAFQKQLLENAYDSWRGDHEQIDDVSVIGVRI